MFSAIKRILRRFGLWVGTILTWVLFAPTYWLIFAPVHLILKLRGVDPMDREFKTAATTYWRRRPRKNMLESMKRQW